MQQEITDQAEKLELAMNAIMQRQTVIATYNGSRMEIQPHQLFVRHSSLYLAALNPSKSRKHDEEPVLGEYNMMGLSGLALGEQRFEPLASFDGQSPRDDDHVLISCEAD